MRGTLLDASLFCKSDQENASSTTTFRKWRREIISQVANGARLEAIALRVEAIASGRKV